MKKPLKIYVAGPYRANNAEEIKNNIARADAIAKELALLGHTPFVPHTMIDPWQNDSRFSFEKIMELDSEWLKVCDALFYVSPSTGADQEMEYAKKFGLLIFTSLEELK